MHNLICNGIFIWWAIEIDFYQNYSSIRHVETYAKKMRKIWKWQFSSSFSYYQVTYELVVDQWTPERFVHFDRSHGDSGAVWQSLEIFLITVSSTCDEQMSLSIFDSTFIVSQALRSVLNDKWDFQYFNFSKFFAHTYSLDTLFVFG